MQGIGGEDDIAIFMPRQVGEDSLGKAKRLFDCKCISCFESDFSVCVCDSTYPSKSSNRLYADGSPFLKKLSHAANVAKEVSVKRTRLFMAFVVTLFLFVSLPSLIAEEKQVPVIKIGHVGHDHQIALCIAAMQADRFEKEFGVYLKEKKPREVYDLIKDGKVLAEVQVLKVGGGSQMPAAMEKGEIAIGYGGLAAIVYFRDKGNAFKVIAPLHTAGDMLVMKKGIELNSWEEFVKYVKASDKPVKIGYKAPVAVAKIIFERALKEEGIPFGVDVNLKDEAGMVHMINLQGDANMVPSLASGAVDGIVMNQPACSTAKIKGIGHIVCDLEDLPPTGLWKDHACCCIAATDKVMADHPDVVSALLEITVIATDYINEDKKKAAQLAAEWTKLPLEIELDSVPTINYIAEFTEAYIKNLIVWAEIMNEMNQFSGELKDKKGEEFIKLTCKMEPLEEARRLVAERRAKNEAEKKEAE